jgi:hypothetical protein
VPFSCAFVVLAALAQQDVRVGGSVSARIDETLAQGASGSDCERTR